MKNINVNTFGIQELPPQKIIFCDIDGTLLDKNKNIHPKTKESLKSLINNNSDYHFSLISGRNLIDELFIYRHLELKNTSLLISCNGAQIYSLKSHKILYEKILNSNAVENIYLKFLELKKQKKDISIIINYRDSSVFCDNISDEQIKKYYIATTKVHKEFNSKDVINISIFCLNNYLENMMNFLNNFDVEIIKGKILTSITAKKLVLLLNKVAALIYNIKIEIKMFINNI